MHGLGKGTYRMSTTLLPEYHGFGIWESMVSSAIDLGRKGGVETIIDYTAVELAPMIRILEKAGFTNLTASDEKPGYYGDVKSFFEREFGEEIPEKYHIWELNLGEESGL